MSGNRSSTDCDCNGTGIRMVYPEVPEHVQVTTGSPELCHCVREVLDWARAKRAQEVLDDYDEAARHGVTPVCAKCNSSAVAFLSEHGWLCVGCAMGDGLLEPKEKQDDEKAE